MGHAWYFTECHIGFTPKTPWIFQVPLYDTPKTSQIARLNRLCPRCPLSECYTQAYRTSSFFSCNFKYPCSLNRHPGQAPLAFDNGWTICRVLLRWQSCQGFRLALGQERTLSSVVQLTLALGRPLSHVHGIALGKGLTLGIRLGSASCVPYGSLDLVK